MSPLNEISIEHSDWLIINQWNPSISYHVSDWVDLSPSQSPRLSLILSEGFDSKLDWILNISRWSKMESIIEWIEDVGYWVIWLLLNTELDSESIYMIEWDIESLMESIWYLIELILSHSLRGMDHWRSSSIEIHTHLIWEESLNRMRLSQFDINQPHPEIIQSLRYQDSMISLNHIDQSRIWLNHSMNLRYNHLAEFHHIVEYHKEPDQYGAEIDLIVRPHIWLSQFSLSDHWISEWLRYEWIHLNR